MIPTRMECDAFSTGLTGMSCAVGDLVLKPRAGGIVFEAWRAFVNARRRAYSGRYVSRGFVAFEETGHGTAIFARGAVGVGA